MFVCETLHEMEEGIQDLTRSYRLCTKINVTWMILNETYLNVLFNQGGSWLLFFFFFFFYIQVRDIMQMLPTDKEIGKLK